MPASTEFSVDIEHRLEAIDALIDALREDLDALGALREPDGAAIPQRLDQALRLIAELRAVVAQAAQVVALEVPQRPQRAALKELTTAIYGRLVAHEALQRRRARLRELADEIAAGELLPRPIRRLRELSTLRQQTVAELLRHAEGPAPELPGPEAGLWLGWVWSLEEPGLSEMLDELAQTGPVLTDFVQQVQPDWWHQRHKPGPPEPAPAGRSQTTPSATASRSTPTPAPAALQESAEAPQAQQQDPPSSLTPEITTHVEQEPPLTAADQRADADAKGPAARSKWPDELRSYQAFRERYWIDAADACSRVPWTEAAFRLRLDSMIADELRGDRFFRMWILARAAQQLDADPLLTTGDVAALCDAWAAPLGPQSPPAAKDRAPGDLGRGAHEAAEPPPDDRADLLRRALSSGAALDSPMWRLRATLAALAPSPKAPLTAPEADDLVERLQLQDAALHLVVQCLLHQGPGALLLLRQHLSTGAAPDQGDLPLEEARALLRASLHRADEDLCRRLLCRHLAPKDSATSRDELHPLDLTVSDLCRYPGLLGLLHHLDEDALHAGGPAAIVARCTTLRDPLRAAALLLQPEPTPYEDAHIDRLRRRLWERRRIDLLGTLTCGMLPHEQTRVHAERAGLIEQLHCLLSEARAAAAALRCLGAQVAGEVQAACADAQATLGAEHALSEPALLHEYLSQVIGQAQEAERGALEDRAAPSGDRAGLDEVAAALEAGRYRDARRLLGQPLDEAGQPAQQRSTAWRAAAARQFPDPAARLAQYRTQPGGEHAGMLLEAWRRGVTGQQQADWTLRTSFSKLVFGQRHRDTRLHATGMSSSSDFRLPCAEAREWLAREFEGPSYTPQLRRFTHLTVLTPPSAPSDPAFAQRLADLCARYPHDLSLVLCPHLPAAARDGLLGLLRERRVAAAIIDDLDLCRLFSPGVPQADLLLGVLEIALQQLPLAAVSPFGEDAAAADLFTGRRAEARALGIGGVLGEGAPGEGEPACARLSGGRHLGKTALLHFVAAREDGRALPEGGTLRAVYLSLRGLATDREVGQRVIAALDQRLLLPAPGGAHEGLDPDQALPDALQRFVVQREDECLLLLLDDADDFIAAQVAVHAQDPARCLLHRLRGLLRAQHESAPRLWPRVRLVLCGAGELVDRGPWAAAPPALRLSALPPEEAATLIEGPLVRIGIDARRQAAAIAYLCGYHPAVLLRFGAELLVRLARPVRGREDDVVGTDDVTAVFQGPVVQAALRAAVEDNFAADRRARVLFLALVLELAELAPGASLQAERLLDRLQMIDGDTSWLQRGAAQSDGDRPAPAIITEYLERMVHSGLLTTALPHGPEDPAYRLRAPQHLWLFRAHIEATLLDEIEALRLNQERPAEVS